MYVSRRRDCHVCTNAAGLIPRSRAHIAQTVELLHRAACQELLEVLYEAAQQVRFDK